RGGEGGRRGGGVDRAVGQGRLLIGGGEVHDLDVAQGQSVLLEHRGQQVAAGRAGTAGHSDLAAGQVGDRGDGAVVDQLLTDLQGGRGGVRVARGDAHGPDDLELQTFAQRVEQAGAEACQHHVQLVVGKHRDAVISSLDGNQLVGDAFLVDIDLVIGTVHQVEQ